VGTDPTGYLNFEEGEDGEVWVGYAGEPKSTQFGLKSLRH